MVCFSLLKKPVIPFTIITTSSLFLTFKSTLAATKENPFGTLLERGDVRKGLFTKEKIVERGGSLEEFKNFFGEWEKIFKKIDDVSLWFNDIYQHISDFSIDLFSYIYEILTKIVIHTPLFIFNNPYLKNTSLTLSIISITLVTILTVFESIMQISKQRHTKFTDILKRYPIAIAITGFTPFLFEKGFTAINKLSSAITHIGGVVNRNDLALISAPSSGLDVLIMLIFDGMLLGLLIPILLQNGRRWFDLLVLAVISPLAFTAFCFDRHRHYFDKWLTHVKKLSLVQIVYAMFIMLMGVMLYGTRFMTGGLFEVFIPKALITLGCLHALSNPPKFILAMTDNGHDVVGMGESYANTFKKTYKTLTLQNFKPAQMIKNQINKTNDHNMKIKDLRKKHGKRSVNDLL